MSTARGTLRLVLGDQLSPGLSALEDIDVENDVVLMAEVAEEATYVRHHPKKIVFLFSAMRHFAETLRERGVRVWYVQLGDPDNSGSIPGELRRAVAALDVQRVVTTECGEWRLQQAIADWSGPVLLETREDTRFIASRRDFAQWAEGRKQLRMEYFYREMRKRTGLLMQDDGSPAGGQWNFDKDNRQPPDDGLFRPPAVPEIAPDEITKSVIDVVRDRFPDHYGSLDPFTIGTSAGDAERCADFFIRERLALFGDYQDAMLTGEPQMYHSLLSQYLNAGLLDPLDLCRRAEKAWQDGAAPLNAVEGFIRQILGWREFVRGLYWLKMPDYAESNFLNAKRPLPEFFWTAETEMNCLHQCIGQTLGDAYAHHIQRLMVIGNFALLAGLTPKAVCEWYLCVYIDAYEWVELPNTHGMALFADGGQMGSKPYAASGKYIDRMSDYCAACRFDPKKPAGKDACPFNYLYWDFMERHADTLSGNPRMAMMYKSLSRMADDKRAAIADSAARFLKELK
ncbi:MAG: cryptochrome/photolyase family protein [Alphaproteobacteria bacterium]|nr:cryptochrome/photolyase family protein [Alphaproteobacteria bacterium]